MSRALWRHRSSSKCYVDLRTETQAVAIKRNPKHFQHYVHRFCETVQAGLREKLGQSFDPVAARQLQADLGMGASLGSMPDFSNVQALRGYTLGHFGRARLLSNLVTLPTPDWLPYRVSEIFPANKGESKVHIASLAGGPGYDFVSFAALSEFQQGPHITATVYEYEPAWKEIVADVEAVVQDVCKSSETAPTRKQQKYQCGWDPCDITLTLDAAKNESLASSLSTTQVYACCYVIAENSSKLRQQNYQFFRQLMEEASDGSLFFFTETTHRQWPDIIDLALQTGQMRISIPHLRRGKVGWQLALLKDTGVVGSDVFSLSLANRELYERFQRHDRAHQEKMNKRRESNIEG